MVSYTRDTVVFEALGLKRVSSLFEESEEGGTGPIPAASAVIGRL
jgi:hypothetical protein